jgi:hypothetical protein
MVERTTSSSGRLNAVLVVMTFVAIVPGVAHALDPFEIQVYDGTASPPGHAGLELHVNHWRGSQPGAQPVLPLDRQTHMTLEPSLGVLPFLELGAYVQAAVLADGSLDFAGAKLRAKVVTPEGWHEHLRLGINFELSGLPRKFEADRFGGEIRPIIGWDDRWFIVAANPNLEVDLTNAGWRDGPGLAPSVQALLKIPDVVGIGVEYYAELGPMKRIGKDPTAQYLFGVAQLLADLGWELNVGVGFGLTDASEDVIVKAIVGHELVAF